METNSSINTTKPPRAGRREWTGLAVIALPCLLYSMDLTVLNLALPSLSADLKPSSSELLWIVDIYGFMIAGSLITMGTLGDRIGRRKLLMIGALAFSVASILAAFSNSSGMLIATRALLGIAGATLAPSTLSLIRNMFMDPGQRTFAVGVWITSFSVGGAIGPLLGGLMLEHFWWGSVFLIGVPVMVLLLILAPLLLPEFRNPQAGRLDLVSAGMSLIAVLALIYGLKQIAQNGMTGLSVVTITAGIGIGVMFLRRQRTLNDPLIDLQLFRVSSFNTVLITNTLGLFMLFGAFLFLAQYLQLVLGLSPLKAGLWTMPSSGGFVLGSMLTPVIVRGIRPAYVMGAGLVLASIGFGLLTQLDSVNTLAVLVTGTVLFSLGIAPVVTLSTDAIISAAPPERAGAAASISETSAEFGGALGIAILGSIGTVVYRNIMADASLEGIPSAVKVAARDTLGGAITMAEGLPSQLSIELLETSQDAFKHAFDLNAMISATLAVIIGIVAIVLLRHLGMKPE